MNWASLIPLILQAGGGIAGQAASAGDREQQRRILEKAMAEWGAIQAPELKDDTAEQLGPSALEGIQEDPRLREAQLASLGTLDDMIKGGGYTLEDRAALNRINAQQARRENAGRAQIANDFAARGQLGSGAQLAMSLQNQQDSANRAADAGLDQAAQAQRRYFDAVMARSKAAGDMSDRDYQREASKARARDLIQQHNAAARMDTRRYNNTLASQRFANQGTLASGRSGQGARFADYLGRNADRTAEMWARGGDALAKYYAASQDDEEKKP